MVALAPSAEAAKKPSVITTIKIVEPKPLYNDELAVTVSFVAKRPAKPGFHYVVSMFIYGKEPLLSCSDILNSSDPDFGGNPRRKMKRAGWHKVTLFGKTQAGIPNSIYLCRGKGYVFVMEEKIGNSKVADIRGSLEMRVAEAP